MIQAEASARRSDIMESSLILAGTAIVVGGTLLPFTQSVFDADSRVRLFVTERNDWTFRFPFGFFSFHTLTHYPGLVIAIIACFTIIFEARVQRQSAAIRLSDRRWGMSILVPEMVAILAMALLVLLSWPVTGQGFAVNRQGFASTNSVASQMVILRGPGAVVSFIGIAMCLYVLLARAASLWALRTRTSTSERVKDGALRH